MNLDLTRQSLLTNILYIVLLSIIFWGSWVVAPEFNVATRGAAPSTTPSPITHHTIEEATQHSSGTNSLATRTKSIVELNQGGTAVSRWLDETMGAHPLFSVVLSSLLVLINSMTITRIAIRHTLFFERSYMPALVYVIISVGYFNSPLSFAPLLASWMVLAASGLVIRSLVINNLATGCYLKIGFYLGAAAIIAPWAIILLPVLFLALTSFRSFSLREWIAGVVGWILPLFFAAYTGWALGGSFENFYVEFVAGLLSPDPTFPTLRAVNLLQWSFMGIVGALIILSILKFTARRKAYSLKAYKAYLYFIWMLAVITLGMVFLPCRSLNMLPVAAVPLSVIIPTYFNATKPSFWMNFLYALLILGVVALNLTPIL